MSFLQKLGSFFHKSKDKEECEEYLDEDQDLVVNQEDGLTLVFTLGNDVRVELQSKNISDQEMAHLLAMALFDLKNTSCGGVLIKYLMTYLQLFPSESQTILQALKMFNERLNSELNDPLVSPSEVFEQDGV